MRDSLEQIIDRLYKLMVIGSCCDPDLEEEIRRLKNGRGRGSPKRDTYTPQSVSGRSERMKSRHSFNRLLKLTTGAKLKRGASAGMGQYIKPAFRLPKKSCFIDSSLFWFWVDTTRRLGSRSSRWTNWFTLVVGDVRMKVLYDLDKPESRFTESVFRCWDLESLIKRHYFCRHDTFDIWTRFKVPHGTNFEPGKEAQILHKYIPYGARVNFWRLRRGDFSPEFTQEAINEIENQTSFLDGRMKICRQWKDWKKEHGLKPTKIKEGLTFDYAPPVATKGE